MCCDPYIEPLPGREALVACLVDPKLLNPKPCALVYTCLWLSETILAIDGLPGDVPGDGEDGGSNLPKGPKYLYTIYSI